jgi:3-oxoadipate enol-lactonase
MLALHHVSDGPADGDVVVLNGSLGSDLRMWTPQVAPLAGAGYRVVRVDHRGHGRSPVPDGPYTLADLGGDMLELADRLGTDRIHWVGLSLGGMVGMWLATHAPEQIASLTLCCTAATMDPAPWAERARLVRAGGTEAVADAVVARWFTPAWRAAHPAETTRYRDMIAATPAEGYASCCAAIQHMNLLPRLDTITAPTLVISAANDAATPPAAGEQIAAAIPGSRFEVVDGAAHLGSAEQPERFTQLILQHLDAAPRIR